MFLNQDLSLVTRQKQKVPRGEFNTNQNSVENTDFIFIPAHTKIPKNLSFLLQSLAEQLLKPSQKWLLQHVLKSIKITLYKTFRTPPFTTKAIPGGDFPHPQAKLVAVLKLSVTSCAKLVLTLLLHLLSHFPLHNSCYPAICLQSRKVWALLV